jgi:hypothetical protein
MLPPEREVECSCAKEQKAYPLDEEKESPPYVESTSKPVADDWSVRAQSGPGSPAVAQPAEGGAQQHLIPDRGAFGTGKPT